MSDGHVREEDQKHQDYKDNDRGKANEGQPVVSL